MTEQGCRVAGVLMAATALASAQTNAPAESTTQMAPLVVTASRLERTSMEMAANASIITAEQIRGSGLVDTAQAVEMLGGVYMRRLTGNPSLVDISMRGFGENSHGRVLVLVDGVRINNADMAAPNLQRVPLQNVERIEIIRGPAAAMYGDYAVSGVINIITKAPTDAPETTVSAYAGSDTTWGTAITLRGPIAEGTHYSASAVWDSSDGYRKNSAYRAANVAGGVTQTFTERLDATISAFYNNSKYEMPGSLTLAQMKDDPRQSFKGDDDYRMQLWGAGLNLNAATQNDTRLTLATAVSRRDSTTKAFGSTTENVLDTVQLSPRVALPFDIGGLRDTLTVGGDFYYERLDNRIANSTTGARTSQADIDRFTIAAYAQNELQLTDRLSYLLGGRVERSRLEADTLIHSGWFAGQADESVSQTGTAWDTGFLFRPVDELKLYARVGSVYRYPFIDEQASFNGFGVPGVNADLKPERGMNYELGSELQLASEFTFALSAYQMDMKDEIVYDMWNNKQVNMNKTRHQGADAELAWQRKDVAAAGLQYSLVRSKFTAGPDDGNDVPLVPNHVITLRGELSLKTDFALLAALRGVGSQFLGGDYANTGDKMSSHGTLDLGLRYRPSYAQGLQLLFSCDNVFDKTYATMGYSGGSWGPDSYYPASGRAWRLAASYSF